MIRHQPAAAARVDATASGSARRRRPLRPTLLLALAALLCMPAAAQQRDRYDDQDVFSDDELGNPPPERRDYRDYRDDREYREFQDDRGRPPARADDYDAPPPADARTAPPPADDRAANTPAYSTDQPQGTYRTQSPRCRELESQLASDYWRGQDGGSSIPDLNQRIARQEDLYNKLQNDADRADCYENMFIFGRSLRRTKKCLDIDGKIRDAKRDLMNLRDEQAAIRDSRSEGNNRSRLIEELARNNCGEQYRYESQRSRSSSDWFGNSGFGELLGIPSRPKPRPADAQTSEIQPYATYRTMCVRLCDGFYYPVSFSTLPSNFPQDADACRSGCAAPAELFVYRNPGGEVEQMIAPDGRPYDGLPNAWRFRKEFIQGCSCKPAEFSEADIAAYETKSAAKPAAGADPAAPSAPAGDVPAAAGQGKSSALPTGRAADAGAARATPPAPPPAAPATVHVTPDKARSIDDLIR